MHEPKETHDNIQAQFFYRQRTALKSLLSRQYRDSNLLPLYSQQKKQGNTTYLQIKKPKKQITDTILDHGMKNQRHHIPFSIHHYTPNCFHS